MGLKTLVFVGTFIGGLELTKILFAKKDSFALKFIFYVLLVATFLGSCQRPDLSGIILSLAAITFCLLSLLKQNLFTDIQEVALFQGRAVVGFFYMGLLPSFVFQIINIPQGILWLVSLFSVVFSGDIFAYLVGLKLGQKKLMPLISPKKTIEGALGGLFGSMFAGVICALFLLNASIPAMLILSLIAGVAAQFGDLFESLLKRIAEVKDSGKIMPGHGGVLDRIDGVLFASPIFLFGAIILQKFH